LSGDRLEEFYQWSKDKIINSKSGSGKISAMQFPHEIKVDTWYRISATYTGNGESAFFSSRIQDAEGNFCWYGDYDKSIKRGFDYNGEYFEMGMLNLNKESYSSEWAFKADPGLKPGKGIITVGVFEMKDSIGADGQTKQFRPHITLVQGEILLV
jgi:hypothetical protein